MCNPHPRHPTGRQVGRMNWCAFWMVMLHPAMLIALVNIGAGIYRTAQADKEEKDAN